MTEPNDTGNEPARDAWPAPQTPPTGAAQPRRAGRLRGRTAAMATVVGFAGGGLIGGYAITQAATSPSPSPSPATSPNGSTTIPPAGDNDGPHGGGMPGGPRLGGSNDQAEDQQTVATAIGISVTQLQTELAKDGTIAAVAKAHSVDPAKVIQALVDAKNREIDAAVAAGTLTQAQGTAAKAQAQQEATDQVDNTRGPGGPGFGPGGHGPGPGGGAQQEDLAVAAGALGISASELQADISNGQTIAAVAKARNVDLAKVISALADSENKEIDARVASGQLTQAQGTQEKAGVTQRVTDLVNNTDTDGH